MSVRVGWSAVQADRAPGIPPPPPLLAPPRTDRKLIGQLRSLSDLLPHYWPVLVSPQGPNRRYSPNTNRCLKRGLVSNPTLHPFSLVSSYFCHSASAKLFTSALLGSPTAADFYDLHKAHVHQFNFPIDASANSRPVPRSYWLPPEPVPFPAVSVSRRSLGRLQRARALVEFCAPCARQRRRNPASLCRQLSRVGSWKGRQPPLGAL